LGSILLAWLDAATREVTLFAAVGFLIAGADDLLVDLMWLARRLRRRGDGITLDDLPAPIRPRRFAILVPAWDESAVIGAMLRHTLARLDHPDFIIIVGCYPNDRATIAVVADIATRDRRVRLTIGMRHGPTTKADCLNTLWHAIAAADLRDRRRTDAIVLHDAEDVVHAAELRVFDALLDRHAVVQIPVLPLARRESRLVAGHYLDEFAEAHGKQLPVRTLLRAAVPLAGVGCAIRIEALARIDPAAPFDPSSLTEDYELGLRLAAIGCPAYFARVCERRGGPPVAVREYFPATIAEAVRQKARWMTGIALAGWDRLGWSRIGDIGDHWMRLHDRRAPFAVIVLAMGYAAIVGWAASAGAHLTLGTAPPPPGPATGMLLLANAALLVWRATVRTGFTAAAYGWREALWAPLRMIVGNIIALLAARRAATRYAAILAGGAPQWDKTAHAFPTDIA